MSGGMNRKKLLVIDGNSILNRAFYGVKPLTTSDGRPTNAVFGFVNIILKQLEELSPESAAIAFDLREPTFRHKKYDFYKANRHGMPDELACQVDYAKKAAEYLGFNVLSIPGFEADDILGTCAKNANCDRGCDYDCYILTGDRDSFQLIDKKSFVLLCTNTSTVFYDEEKIKETYGGLCPKDLIDLKALMGDSSDNIPGVPGIGEKTALKLMTEFGSLDNLYENYSASSLSAGIKQKLENGRELAYASKFLAEICTQVPLPVSFSDLSYRGFDKEKLYSLFSDLELKTFISRLSLTGLSDHGISLFDTESEACEFTDFINTDTLPVLCGETGVYPDFESKKIYIDGEKLYVVPLTNENLTSVFNNPDLKTVVFDSKEIYRYFLDENMPFLPVCFDVMLAEYVISPSGKNNITDILSGRDYSGFNLSDEIQKYLCCTKLLKKAKEELSEKIKNYSVENLYYNIELPLAKTLAEMEHEGFLLDVKGLSEYGLKLDKRIAERQQNIYLLAGKTFNINSPKQLSEVLFSDLSLPGFKKTKSGYSTDAETLEKLRPFHPIINEILDFRTVTKLKSTYVEGLLKVCDKNTCRVHTTFKQAFTQTGRLSSAEPNLQNIPIKQDEGRELRKFFIAKKDCVLIDADYSQIELRVLAALSGDESMCDSFRHGVDIHAVTASQVFAVPLDEVSPLMRKNAKAVNFGIVYGISDFSLAGDIGTTKKQAAEYIQKYFEKYPKIKSFLDEQIFLATKNGYCSTYFGRRRYIPELTAKNKNMQAFGRRIAMNSPIQGTSADIIKLAMVNISRALARENLRSKLILQVHDELIVESPADEAEKVCEMLKHEMETAVNFSIPLSVSLSYGKSWYDAHL